MGTSDVLKVFKIARTSPFFVYLNVLNKITPLRYFPRLGCTLFETLFNALQNARMFYLSRNYNNFDGQTKPKIVFLVFQK